MSWIPPKLTEEQKETVRITAVSEDGEVFYNYNPAKEPNPHAVGTHSRVGFLFNPYYHPLGKFLQGKVKGSILKSIDFVHSSILRYDSEAYTYSDERLQALYKTGHECIINLFDSKEDPEPFRKPAFMLKLLDICLFLMKEDIFYRYRFIELMKQMGRTAEHLEPTGEELANLMRGNDHGISN